MFYRVELRSPDDRVLAARGFADKPLAHDYARELRKRVGGGQSVHVIRNPAPGEPRKPRENPPKHHHDITAWVKECVRDGEKYAAEAGEHDDPINEGWALSPPLPQANRFEQDLVSESNAAFVEEHLEGLANRDAEAHDGQLGEDFEKITDDVLQRWTAPRVAFRPWDEDEDGKQIPSEVAESLFNDIFDALDGYPLLDEDDHSRREMESTEENFRDEGQKWVRDDAPEGWVGEILHYMYEHESDYGSNLEARDGGGAWPDEDDLLEVMHELKLLSPEAEEEYFSEAETRDVDIRTRFVGPVTVELHFHKNTAGEWNHTVDGVVRLKHGGRTVALRFAPVDATVSTGRGFNNDPASEIAADIVAQARRQRGHPAFADALMEAFGDEQIFEITDEDGKVWREYTDRWKPRHLRGDIEWLEEPQGNPGKRKRRQR